jgi:hypothetical protein
VLAASAAGTPQLAQALSRLLLARARWSPSHHPRPRRRCNAAVTALDRKSGSPPPARALLGGEIIEDDHGRVTPARAGCAETCGVVQSARSDHSCSHRLHGAGVASGLDLRDHYSPACAVSPALNTEDQRTELLPLARALRPRAPGRPDRALPAKSSRGVTPARAGATWCSARSAGTRTSHFRSRGRYTEAAAESALLHESPRSRRLFIHHNPHDVRQIGSLSLAVALRDEGPVQGAANWVTPARGLNDSKISCTISEGEPLFARALSHHRGHRGGR